MISRLLPLFRFAFAQTDCLIVSEAYNEMQGILLHAPTPDNCCGVNGIACFNDTITDISWPGSYFLQKKIISAKIGSLLSLNSLSLTGFELESVPNFIFKLTKLKYLSLENSQISGHIPNEIGQLTELLML